MQTNAAAARVGLTDEYFLHVEKYKNIYGPETVVLLQNGSFYEMYGIDNASEKIFPEIKDICETLDIFLSRKNKGIKENGRNNPLMAGFPTWSCEKHIQKLLDHGHTVVLFEQREIQGGDIQGSAPAYERVLTQVLSPSLQSEYHRSIDAQHCICFYMSAGSEYLTKTEFWNVSTAIISVFNGAVYMYDTTHTRTERKDSVFFDMLRILRTHEANEVLVVLGSHCFSRCRFFWRKQLAFHGTIHVIDTHDSVESPHSDISKVFSAGTSINDLKKCRYQDEFFNRVFRHSPPFGGMSRIEAMNLEKYPHMRLSLIFLLQFVSNHNVAFLEKLQDPVWYEYLEHRTPRFCRVENNSLEQLGILLLNYKQQGIAVPRTGSRSLAQSHQPQCVFDVINETITAAGHRMLKDSVCRPLVDVRDIQERQRMVQAMKANVPHLEATREHLRRASDIERLHRRLQLRTAWFSDLAALETTYEALLAVMGIWVDKLSAGQNDRAPKSVVDEGKITADAVGVFECLREARGFLRENLNISNCASTPRNQTVELAVFNLELYGELSQLHVRRSAILSRLEEERRTLEDTVSTWIKQNTLNHAAGKKNTPKKKKTAIADDNVEENDASATAFVKLEYTDKEKYFLTMANTKLKCMQEMLSQNKDLSAHYRVKTNTLAPKISSKQMDVLNEELSLCRENIDRCSKRELAQFVQRFGAQFEDVLLLFNYYLGYIDFLQSGAYISLKYCYVLPKVDAGTPHSFVAAEKLRHPLVERVLQTTVYVANDVAIGTREKSGYLIFGTNSCGKSVFMKSVGVAVVLAQMGYDVPCAEMTWSPFHNIITRMTGTDDPLKGQSSFAVEMIELNLILTRSSQFSLVLGDEVCHGTEQVSGISLVAASLMHLCAKRVPFVFASHLHQLSKMEEITKLENLAVKHMTVKRDVENGTLVYERKLKEGSGDATYGIEVARHIIDDADFLSCAEVIQRGLLERPQNIVPEKISRYNPLLFVDACQVCGKKAVETHHIIQQKEADTHRMVSAAARGGGPVGVHHLANLVALCVKCHLSIHKTRGKRLCINGYDDTSEGPRLDFYWTQ